MSSLLEMSERDVQVKEEMNMLELRLSRLHRLIEQAVVQINQCTERRNQLLQDQQEISEKRLALLRDATSSMHSSHSSISDMHAPNAQERDATGPTASHTTSATTHTSKISSQSRLSSQDTDTPGGSLSKADWLAKFSSYLPPEMHEKDQSATDTATEKDSPPSPLRPTRHPLRSPRVSLSEPQEDSALGEESSTGVQPQREDSVTVRYVGSFNPKVVSSLYKLPH